MMQYLWNIAAVVGLLSAITWTLRAAGRWPGDRCSCVDREENLEALRNDH